MKKLICIILALTVSVGAFCFPAGALEEGDIFIEGDFRCKIVNGAVSIVRYLGEQGEDVDVVIPETIRGYTVKYIEPCSFGSLETDSPPCYTLHRITLPDTIEAVGSGAFANNFYSGAIINLPESLKYIDSYAFYDCDLSENMKQIPTDEGWSFDVLELPGSVEYIFGQAFSQGYICVSENLKYVYDKPCMIGLVAPLGSYAQEYCEKYNFRFTAYGYMYGDADENGTIDVADIISIKQAIMSGVCPTKYHDVDKNGKLDVADILTCKNKIMNPNVATEEWLKSVHELWVLL